MEGHLKRHLGPDEIVHHVNSDRTDDRIENLEVVTRSEHGSLHMYDRWATEREDLLRAQREGAGTHMSILKSQVTKPTEAKA
jgi:hypothetical protein